MIKNACIPQRSIANAGIGLDEDVCGQHKPRNASPLPRTPKQPLRSPGTEALKLASHILHPTVGQSLIALARIARSGCHLRRGVGALVLLVLVLLLLL